MSFGSHAFTALLSICPLQRAFASGLGNGAEQIHGILAMEYTYRPTIECKKTAEIVIYV